MPTTPVPEHAPRQAFSTKCSLNVCPAASSMRPTARPTARAFFSMDLQWPIRRKNTASLVPVDTMQPARTAVRLNA